MKKKHSDKLKLTTDTIRALTVKEDDLKQVAGGTLRVSGGTCTCYTQNHTICQ